MYICNHAYIYVQIYTCIYIYTYKRIHTNTHIYMYTCIYIYTLLCRHVSSELAGCCSFPPSLPVNAGHRHWLWSAKCYLDLQISPTPVCSFKGEVLSFLSGFSVQHYFGIWVSFISQITCLHFPTKKRQLFMCLHPLTIKWWLIMCLHPLMNKRQQTSLRTLKIHHTLFFLAVSSSVSIMVAGLPLRRCI